MITADIKKLEVIIDILEKDVFPKVNAASGDAAISIIECTTMIRRIIQEDQDDRINKRTEASLDFAKKCEPILDEFITKCDEERLKTFVYLSDEEGDARVSAGSMKSKSLAQSIAFMLVAVPNLAEPVLTQVGFPKSCIDECCKALKQHQDFIQKEFGDNIEIDPDNKED